MGFKQYVPEEINLDNEICNLKYFDQRKSSILIKTFFIKSKYHKDIPFTFDDAVTYVLSNMEYIPLINNKFYIDFWSNYIKEFTYFELTSSRLNRTFVNSIFLKETMKKIVSLEGFHYFYLTLNK